MNFTVYGFAFYFITDLYTSNISNDLKKDEDEYGESENLNFLLHYYGKNFGIDTYFQRYKGFYIENSEDRYTTWTPGDPLVQFPDMEIHIAGLNLYYIFSGDKFSLRAAYDQSEIQVKSAGSFMLMLSFNYFSLKNETSIIPSSVDNNFGSISGLEKGIFLTTSLSPGYAYTFSNGSFFFTPALFVGAGGQYQIIKTSFGDKVQFWRYTLKLNSKVSLGYNGESFITGVTCNFDMTQIVIKDGILESVLFDAYAYVGIRF